MFKKTDRSEWLEGMGIDPYKWSEADLQEAVAKKLRRQGFWCDREVQCGWGRADLVTDYLGAGKSSKGVSIIELKKELDYGKIYRCLGQLVMYYQNLPSSYRESKPKIILAGLLDEREPESALKVAKYVTSSDLFDVEVVFLDMHEDWANPYEDVYEPSFWEKLLGLLNVRMPKFGISLNFKFFNKGTAPIFFGAVILAYLLANVFIPDNKVREKVRENEPTRTEKLSN